MTENPGVDPTLPSVVADLDGKYNRARLVLTIAFHPDTARIGEVAYIVAARQRQQWDLGRNGPAFAPDLAAGAPAAGAPETVAPGAAAPGAARPLADLYLSRSALRLAYSVGSLVLERDPGACRCQINGRELDGESSLNADQLREGVTIFLAHRVLILLREVSGTPAVPPVDMRSQLKGGSAYMATLKKQILSAAASDLDVLIRGETGTGKELVASAIHANSPVSAREMVTVNMSAIPVALAPAALFGNTKGAFTGADSAGVGYFQQAQGSTLFLDEVGDTPREIQAQLLRALQQREIQPVGGRVQRVDLRIIAATDAPLDKDSDFKSALRHRLGGCEIRLRPLREHPEDIGELLWLFLQKYLAEASRRHLLPHPDSDRYEVATWANMFHAFVRFSWPGNVRQLSNFARQVALASDSAIEFPETLREELCSNTPVVKVTVTELRNSTEVSDQEFLRAMATAVYEPKNAARLLNISRTGVYRRIAAIPGLRTASQIPESELQENLSACGGDIQRAALALRVSARGLRSRLRSLSAAEE